MNNGNEFKGRTFQTKYRIGASINTVKRDCFSQERSHNDEETEMHKNFSGLKASFLEYNVSWNVLCYNVTFVS